MVASGLRLIASAVFAAAAAVVLAAPPSAPVPRELASLTPPSADAFYRVPDGVDKAKPGTILRHRRPPNPIAAFGLFPLNLKDSHQLLYRTTDSLGTATATVLTVLIPHHANYGKVLSHQAVVNAAMIDCAPSYVFQQDHAKGPQDGMLLPKLDLLVIEATLEHGWVVIVPDFLGPKSAFLANELAGQATLDGIRAAINSGSLTGISRRPKIALSGYSGGTLPSLWAAELQPTYAPELKIAGAAVGGILPNISSFFNSNNKRKSAGLIPAGILGLANQHGDLDALLQQHVLPQYKDEFFAPRRQCLMSNLVQFAYRDVASMLDDPMFIFRHPLAVGLTARNTLGSKAPRIPLFIYHSTKDEVSHVGETDALVRRYCAAGTPVEYQRDPSVDHAGLASVGIPKALAWLRDTLDGPDRRGGCVTRTVLSSLLDPVALEVLPKMLLDTLLERLGKRVGPIIG